ncbi:UDP-N-acetylmuramate dehydrogenase [Granulicella sp. 5B5]|uniref:UDP-N-acetylmuramate dehydrogenase n=1 Tax=Granulicella sp. 5B5 TaxID=1617967 RepID=UPI0015F62575|nr:UDP-N-acetylmuramate dehydrogenase [Granulicella sp. 5B5]QMV20128.1 UDP-N-acetylmuramate dehydrogenase [Granulicella sp. 5B5]
MLTIREHQPLAPLTTFGIGGPARYLALVEHESDIPEALTWAAERELPVFILGGGSNLLIRDTGFNGLVLQIALRGITEGVKGVNSQLTAAAGEPWDAFVDYAVTRNLAGIECLAGIPGLVGGTPVQNVGAYGQEVAETITAVRAFDRTTSCFTTLTAQDCHFAYRASLFNRPAAQGGEPGRYIVTAVTFQLTPNGAPSLRYADLQRRFANQPQPTLNEVATAVREIRRSKGMLLVPGDPDCRSAGSFFKNPIVASETIDRIATAVDIEASTIPHWAATDNQIKLPAAWLLERAGFTKGFIDGAAGISSRHTLALINRGGATFADIERLQNHIIATVRERFGITLEREPVLIG